MSNDLILHPKDVMLCPSGSGEGDPIVIDLKAILVAQSRIVEVQSVTPTKAGELLATFNVSWRDLHQHIVFLEKELNDAERAVNRIRATILLDEVPAILKERGLKDTEKTRDAIIDLDPRYEEAVERQAQITAVIELMKGMLKSMEMAYTSVKKLLGESAFNYLNRNDHRTSGGGSDRDIGETSPDERPAQGSRSGFAKARY